MSARASWMKPKRQGDRTPRLGQDLVRDEAGFDPWRMSTTLWMALPTMSGGMGVDPIAEMSNNKAGIKCWSKTQ